MAQCFVLEQLVRRIREQASSGEQVTIEPYEAEWLLDAIDESANVRKLVSDTANAVNALFGILR